MSDTQQNREDMEETMRQQRAAWEQYYYQQQKMQTATQISGMLQQISPFDVIKYLNQYNVFTLPLYPNESAYLKNSLYQILNDPNSFLSIDDWKAALSNLQYAMNSTNNMQIQQITQNPMGGMMGGGMPGMGMGMPGMMGGGMPGMGMGMPGMMGGGMPGMGMGMPNMYGGMPGMGMGMPNMYGGMYGFNPMGMGSHQNMDFNKPLNDENKSEEEKIAILKNMALNMLQYCDPIVLLCVFIQNGHEIDAKDAPFGEQFEIGLRQAIINSLLRLSDHIFNMICYIINNIYCNTVYNKNSNPNGMPGMGMGMPGMMGGGMPGMGMGGMPPNNMMGYGAPGMGGMPGMMGGGMYTPGFAGNGGFGQSQRKSATTFW
jgi:hypothetical protein